LNLREVVERKELEIQELYRRNQDLESALDQTTRSLQASQADVRNAKASLRNLDALRDQLQSDIDRQVT
jgi:prefoldin subunit 5